MITHLHNQRSKLGLQEISEEIPWLLFPKAVNVEIHSAGLLTYPSFRNLPIPSHALGTVAYDQKHTGITAAGTVREFHPVPFYATMLASNRYANV